jgi:hypothetical protein
MRDPSDPPAGSGGQDMRPPRPDEPPDLTRDVKAFTAAIRTRVFAFLRAWSVGDAAALEILDSPRDENEERWTIERLRASREAHRLEHPVLRLDPEARNLRHTDVKPAEDGSAWRVEQMLVDSQGLNDWVAEFDVDLAASREAGQPVLRLLRLGSLV